MVFVTLSLDTPFPFPHCVSVRRAIFVEIMQPVNRSRLGGLESELYSRAYRMLQCLTDLYVFPEEQYYRDAYWLMRRRADQDSDIALQNNLVIARYGSLHGNLTDEFQWI